MGVKPMEPTIADITALDEAIATSTGAERAVKSLTARAEKAERELTRANLAAAVRISDLRRERDSARAEVLGWQATIERIEALVERWRGEYAGPVDGDYERGYKNARGVDCPDELEAVLKEVKG